ncbi:hypothetical protein JXQ70_08610 [bacterium]|nr:hypothetical protein [bacterium]
MNKVVRPMKTLMCALCVILTATLAFSASLDEVLNDAKDGKLDTMPLIQALLIASNTPSADVSRLTSSTDAKMAQFTSGLTDGPNSKKADTILKNLKASVLKQYYPGSNYKATLEEGKFDPLWGTALLAYVMKKNNVDCSVIETPANYLIAVKDNGTEVLYDIFVGKDPVKPSFEEYLTKSAGLRSSLAFKKLPSFLLSSAQRHDCSRLIAGMLQKRLIQSVSEDNYSDYDAVFKKVNDTFSKVMIDQDKIVETISKKLNICEDPKQAIPLIRIARDTNRKVQVDTKEMNDNAVLASRKCYLAIKGQNDWTTMEKYLNDLKSLVPAEVYTPMAKEGYLKIFNSYWEKKDYSKSEKYAQILCKDLKIEQACPFLIKSQLKQVQDLTQKNKFDDALTLLDKILKQDPKNPDADKLKKYILETQYNSLKDRNDYDGMLAVLNKLRKAYPLDENYRKLSINTFWTWGKTYLDNSQFAEGIRVLTNGYKEFSDYEPLKDLLEASYYNYAINLAKQGNQLKAIEELKKANDRFGDASLQRNDLIADLYLQLSINAAKNGDRSTAMSYTDKGLIYAPGNENLLAQQDNLKRGKDSIEEQAIEFAPWE